MKLLYVFPHPDDESFGPAPAMAKQRRQGHEVHLLTLTRGGATKRRHDFGHSVEEMGELRLAEMREVEKVLCLSGLTVLDLPDSGLKEMDPREIEAAVRAELERLEPEIVVTYPVHGISGFHDHLVCHAVVKRLYVEMAGTHAFLKRLAFCTLSEELAGGSHHFPLSGSTPEEIDCVVQVSEDDLDRARRALDCYVTFQATIAATGIREALPAAQCFEIYREAHDPPLADLCEF